MLGPLCPLPGYVGVYCCRCIAKLSGELKRGAAVCSIASVLAVNGTNKSTEMAVSNELLEKKDGTNLFAVIDGDVP